MENIIKRENLEKEFSPQAYFDYVKDKKKHITDKDLQEIYDNCLKLLNKYLITGQAKGALKLKFHLETIEKEIEVVRLGINTFVYRDDIEDYIDNVADDVVKIIELENYEREIPDEIVEAVAKVKDKFDSFYIVFTDYTGKIEKQVEKDRRDKDPILFGTFEDKSTGSIVERFYYIGDWEDEYCDLTLDKMVAEMKEAKDIKVDHTISTPKTFEELQEQLAELEATANANNFRINNNIVHVSSAQEKKGLFKKIKSFLTK